MAGVDSRGRRCRGRKRCGGRAVLPWPRRVGQPRRGADRTGSTIRHGSASLRECSSDCPSRPDQPASSRSSFSSFGSDGIVDLKIGLDQELDLITGEVGLHAAPVVADGVILVGAAHLPGGAPSTKEKPKGYFRGFDARTGELLWTFHTIPAVGEFGYDTWEEGSAEYSGNAGV